MSKEIKAVLFSSGVIFLSAFVAIVADHKSTYRIWTLVVGVILIVLCSIMAGYYLSPKTKK